MATATTKLGGVSRQKNEPDLSTYKGRLGAAIRARREQLGLTPAQIAEHVGVSEKSIYAYELGTTGIDLDRLPALADALSVPLRKLLPPQ